MTEKKPRGIKRAGDIDEMPPFPFPKVPRYPIGWSCEEVLLCDHSGIGLSHEPALTANQLKDKLRELHKEHPDYRYGIIDVGDFQLKLGVFKKVKDDELST